MNGGIGAVAFAVVLVLVTGEDPTAGWAIGKLVWMCVVGLGLGAVTATWHSGSIASSTTGRPSSRSRIALAYGSFVAAQWLGASGVLAAMAAGFIIGNWGSNTARRMRREES